MFHILQTSFEYKIHSENNPVKYGNELPNENFIIQAFSIQNLSVKPELLSLTKNFEIQFHYLKNYEVFSKIENEIINCFFSICGSFFPGPSVVDFILQAAACKGKTYSSALSWNCLWWMEEKGGGVPWAPNCCNLDHVLSFFIFTMFIIFLTLLAVLDNSARVMLFNYEVLDIVLGRLVGFIYYHLFIFLFHPWVQPPVLVSRFVTFLGKWLNSRSSFSASMSIVTDGGRWLCSWSHFPFWLLLPVPCT